MKINWLKLDSKTLISLFGDFIFYFERGHDRDELREYFYYILTYINQGKYCKDCEKFYTYCECINHIAYSIYDIREFIANFIKYNLSKNNINSLKKEFPHMRDSLKKRFFEHENKLV